MTDEDLRRIFTDEGALRAELARDVPIARIANAIMIAASRKRAQFLAVDIGGVRFWIDGEWYEELTPPPALCEQIVRRFAVMIGLLAPAKEQTAWGTIHLVSAQREHVYQLVMIDRDADHRLRALVELVDAAEFAVRKRPRMPSQHPYRR